MSDKKPLYSILKALGQVDHTEVPDGIAEQVKQRFGLSNLADAKMKLAELSVLASKHSEAEFDAALKTDELSPEALAGVAGGVSNVSAASASLACCGHTWEGTCTPAAATSDRQATAKRFAIG